MNRMQVKNWLPILIISWCFPCMVLGQNTVRLKKVKEDLPREKEIYTVLKSDQQVRHGEYRMLSLKGSIRVKGYYKNGQKDSLWMEYGWNGKVKSKGYYSQDIRTGIWDFYDYGEKLLQQYDYTTQKLVFTIEDTTKKEYLVFRANDSIRMHLDTPPVYIGGPRIMIDHVNENYQYPREAKERGVMGRVQIAVVIDETGKIVRFRVEKGIGAGCDEEAIRVYKLLSGEWIPAYVDGKAVKTEYILPPIVLKIQ